jgi:hypothetical protein
MAQTPAPGSFNANVPTLAIAVTAVASTSIALPAKGDSVRIINEGPNIVFVSIGNGAQSATLPPTTLPGTITSTPILNGTERVFSIGNVDGWQISAICRAAGTATLDIQVGFGS